jgi:hypothetical protein
MRLIEQKGKELSAGGSTLKGRLLRKLLPRGYDPRMRSAGVGANKVSRMFACALR